MPVAIVTGCSSGIGRAVALQLAASGVTTVATARRVDALADLAAAGCTVLRLDVTDDASRRACVRDALAAHGQVDVLVNNAGYAEMGPVEQVPLDAVRRQLETNVVGPVALAQLLLPGMRERGSGRIVNVSSMGGEVTFPGGGVYHASKYALEALSDALRMEAGPFGIQVVVVQPGPVATSFDVNSADLTVYMDGPYCRPGAIHGGAGSDHDTARRPAGDSRGGRGPGSDRPAAAHALPRRRPCPGTRPQPAGHPRPCVGRRDAGRLPLEST